MLCPKPALLFFQNPLSSCGSHPLQPHPMLAPPAPCPHPVIILVFSILILSIFCSSLLLPILLPLRVQLPSFLTWFTAKPPSWPLGLQPALFTIAIRERFLNSILAMLFVFSPTQSTKSCLRGPPPQSRLQTVGPAASPSQFLASQTQFFKHVLTVPCLHALVHVIPSA